MGALLKALAVSSSHRAKRDGLWPTLMEQLTECDCEAAVCAFEARLSADRMVIPYAWDDSLAELVEKRREEIAVDEAALLRSW